MQFILSLWSVSSLYLITVMAACTHEEAESSSSNLRPRKTFSWKEKWEFSNLLVLSLRQVFLIANVFADGFLAPLQHASRTYQEDQWSCEHEGVIPYKINDSL